MLRRPIETTDILGICPPEKAPENPGGLKGSMQHWLAVYPPESEIPTFLVAVDSGAERFHRGPIA